MDEEAFRQDLPFHDAWTSGAGQGDDFALASRDPPAAWERVASDGWIAYLPAGVAVPVQGWVVHVSACLDNAETVLGLTFDYCMDRKIPFKFFRSLNALLIRNSTYMDRGSGGEFVPVCPADERHLEIVLHELGAILEGQAGPDIVSDMRWGDGPLHVRYGAFDDRWCVGPSGELELAITDGDGQLVPDRRGAVFEVPGWVPLPAFLSPHLQALNATVVADIPYVIEIALHFSNGGGLYQARDKVTGEAVVLKEAMTSPGLGQDAEDAAARLRREHDVLTELAGLDAIPAVRGWFTAEDRQFLAEEFVDGASLQDLFMERYPLAMNGPDDAMLATYTAWVLNVQEQLEAAVASVHERGVVLGHLHPGNVFVREDGRLVLIDFEASFRVEEVLMSSLDDAVPRPAVDRRGFAMDEYALASFRLFWFLPLTDLIPLTAGKASELAAEIAKAFPVPREFLARAVSVIAGVAGEPGRAPARLEPDPEGWESTRDSIARAILASATPERADRLFPGDGQQFDGSFTGGLNLAHGAAGVLLALALTGGRHHRSHEEWLVARATAPVGETRLGLYDGPMGWPTRSKHWAGAVMPSTCSTGARPASGGTSTSISRRRRSTCTGASPVSASTSTTSPRSPGTRSWRRWPPA